MNDRLRVLGIAPFEQMREQMVAVASEFPQINLSTFVGDLEEGLSIAQNRYQEQYDIILSRGGTAQLIQSKLTVPVIELKVTAYDIISAANTLNNRNSKLALVSFSRIADSEKTLCKRTNLNIDFFPVSSSSAVKPLIIRLSTENYGAVLCDMIAYNTATELGMKAVLITASADSMRSAFDSVLLVGRASRRIKAESSLLRTVLDSQPTETIVFSSKGELLLSTLRDSSSRLISYFKDEVGQTLTSPNREFQKKEGDTVYTISAASINPNGQPCVLYSILSKKSAVALTQSGITSMPFSEVETAFYGSIYSFSPVADRLSQLAATLSSNLPVLLCGESGSGQLPLAQYLFMHAKRPKSVFTEINCSTLSDKDWARLLEHYNSPLADSGQTICFINLQDIPSDRFGRLASAASVSCINSRNSVIFCDAYASGTAMSSFAAHFSENEQCQTVTLPPLRANADVIPSLVDYYIAAINTYRRDYIAGVSSGGITLMRHYHWPNNYEQFCRIMQKLCKSAAQEFISAEAVRDVLFSDQEHQQQTGFNADAFHSRLTLDEMNTQIVRMVLSEENGNQTAAAKRLGISRTTLWRILKGSENAE